MLDVIGSKREKFRRPSFLLVSSEPPRKTTAADFSINVWTRPGKQVDACFGGRLKERLPSENTFGRIFAFFAFKESL